MKTILKLAVLCIAVATPIAEASEQKAVLVTGASTGIGRVMTEHLADNGFYVYAGARKEKDLQALNALDNVTAVRLDVTIQDDIDAAVKQIEAAGRGLHGLVNNAGVFIGGPATEVPVDEFAWLMDVNVFGVYRVTQAFAPMIIESGGHITTISSISGVGSGPFFSHYSASKHAVEAYADSLAMELEPLGVTVSLIEPGNYSSAIGDTAFKRMQERNYLVENSPFTERMRGLLNYLETPRDRYVEPIPVAEAALHALSSDEPLRRYMVVPDEGEARWAIGKGIEEVAEYNQWQAFQYSRDELVAMLDNELSQRTNVSAELQAQVEHFLANAGDRDTHAAFWAPDLVYTSSSGTRFGRAEIMQGFEEAPDDDAAGPTYSGVDMDVRIHGNTGIVTFTLVGTPAPGSDDPVMRYYNTGTFLKRGDSWRAVAWQATKIPEGE